ncbi:uncharacterized protein [Anabrus simplex]|uniref:uncharacterized protein n=1 Tax=Anabrus simplex TaxID=316456 RepID=UPI0035A345CC
MKRMSFRTLFVKICWFSCFRRRAVPTMFRVNNFCCFCSLQCGATIVGLLSAVISVGLVISGVLCTIAPPTGADFPVNNTMPNNTTDLMNDYRLVWYRIGILTILLYFGQFIVSCLLVYGANMDKPRYVKPWIVYTMVALGEGIITYMVATLMAFKFVGVTEGLTVLLSTVTVALAAFYFIIVVHSFHFKMYGEEGPPKYSPI